MNRIDEAMASWQERQKKYVQQYGANVLNDRSFAKVKLKALKRVLRETRGLKLTNEEKDDRNILKEQVNKLEKKITPNPTVRLIKKFIEKSTDAVVIAWNMGVAIQRKIRERQKDNSYSSDVLTSTEPDYTGTTQQQNGANQLENQQRQDDGQHRHSQSTPLPGNPSVQQNYSTNQHQNRIQARHNNKPRVITQNPGKGFGIK